MVYWTGGSSLNPLRTAVPACFDTAEYLQGIRPASVALGAPGRFRAPESPVFLSDFFTLKGVMSTQDAPRIPEK